MGIGGAIEADNYTAVLDEVNKAWESTRLPLVGATSKSVPRESKHPLRAFLNAGKSGLRGAFTIQPQFQDLRHDCSTKNAKYSGPRDSRIGAIALFPEGDYLNMNHRVIGSCQAKKAF